MIERMTIIVDAFAYLRDAFLAECPREGASGSGLGQSLDRKGPPFMLLQRHEGQAIGYAIVTVEMWASNPVLWVHELYIVPDQRKHGHLKEWFTWFCEYCRYNGLVSILGMAAAPREYQAFVSHCGAEPIGVVFRVNHPETAVYRASVAPVVNVPEAQAPMSLSPSRTKKKVKAMNTAPAMSAEV